MARKPQLTPRPLGQREEQRAIKAALDWISKDPVGLDRTRFRVLGAEVLIEKPSSTRRLPIRKVRVLIADYGHRRNLEVFVDKDGRAVEGKIITGFQPAFQSEEIAEAREIAEQDLRVARILRPGAFALPFAPHLDREPAPRAIGLHYITLARRAAAPLATVVVDLYEQVLISVQDERRSSRAQSRQNRSRRGT